MMMQFYYSGRMGSCSPYATSKRRSKSSILLLLVALLSMAPVYATVDFNLPIQGKVLSESGEALLGATILEKGTTNGTVTDFEGNFQLEVNENAILVVSYTGFATQEVTVAGAMSSLQITLSPSVEALEEVIVTGYGTTKRTNLTNAVSKINSESLQDRPVTSLGEAFSGQLAGVYAQQSSGLPGAEFEIKIRGSNSITSGSEPLYVVDGMPVQSMKDVNIGDVESIDVLKDASAAAIYGARGAGGVVLITTRSAKEGQTQINLDVTTGVRQVPKSNKLDMLTGPEYRDWREWIRNESYILDGRDPTVPVADRPARFRGPDFWYENPEYITDTDWQDAITRNALRQNYQVSVLKGTKGGSFMISGNYTNDQGVVINSGYERFSFRANGQYRINEKFTAGLNLASTFSEQSGWREAERKEGAWMRAIVANPTVPVGLNHRSGPLGLVESDPDPVLQMKTIKDIGNTARTIGTVYLGFEPIEGLNFRGQFGLDNQDWRYDYFKPQDVNKKTRREARDETSRDTRFLTQFTATFDRSFGKHGINLLAGTSYEKTAFERTFLDSWDFGSDDIRTFNAAASFRNWDDFERETALASVFGRVQYDFANKYLLSGSIRYDGSSKFGADNRYGIFPAASFGWRISEEGFLKGNPTLSQLKLRVSWGQSGNDRIGSYSSFATLGPANYPYGGKLAFGFAPSSASNPALGWETTTSLNFGIDFGLWENRIYGSFDIYKNKTTDLLLDVPLPAITGLIRPTTLNSGELENRGWEFELSSVNVRTPNLKWSTSFNLTHNENEVLKLGFGLSNIVGLQRNISTNITLPGYPIASYYFYETDGLLTDVNTEPIAPNQAVGQQKIVDQNGDGKITAADRKIMDDNSPGLIWGLRNSIEYRNFDFSFLINGVHDYQTYFFLGRYIDVGATRNQTGVWANGYRGENSKGNGEAYYPFGAPLPTFTDRWLYDGDYIRVKNITLGYTLPRTTLAKIGVTKFRIFSTADNLLNFTDYPGGNPETNNYNSGDPLSQGSDYGTYPLSRTFVFGVNVSF